MMLGCGLSLFKAWISRKLLTYRKINENETLNKLTFSMLKKLAFIHLMATCLLFLIDYACKTSEKVPSPFLDIKRYSINTKNVSVKIL